MLWQSDKLCLYSMYECAYCMYVCVCVCMYVWQSSYCMQVGSADIVVMEDILCVWCILYFVNPDPTETANPRGTIEKRGGHEGEETTQLDCESLFVVLHGPPHIRLAIKQLPSSKKFSGKGKQIWNCWPEHKRQRWGPNPGQRYPHYTEKKHWRTTPDVAQKSRWLPEKKEEFRDSWGGNSLHRFPCADLQQQRRAYCPLWKVPG